MAYKALYRTYRPQIFDEVVGQKYVLQTLQNAIKEGKIAHAYLFSGPRGTGKTTIAKLLAKGINCTSEGKKPCGECENCLAIARGNHPDVVEIDAASNNGVDEVRELVDKVKYTPIQGKYKVYIIDEVHMMTPGAFNALLKTLEEPPAHVVFVLATTEVHKVIPTIVSRCQRFDFGRVSVQDIKKRIQTVLKNEKLDYDPEVVPFIASLADGGVRDALGILDQALAYTTNRLSLQDIRDIFGIATDEEITRFMHAIEAKDIETCLKMIDEFDAKGIDLIRLTSMLIDVYKSIVIEHKAKGNQLTHNIEQSHLLALSSLISSKKAFEHISILIEALTNYKKINTPKAFFELATLKMCNAEVNEPILSVEIKPTPNVLQEKKEVIKDEPPQPQVQQKIVEQPADKSRETPHEVKKESDVVVTTASIQETPPSQTDVLVDPPVELEHDLYYSQDDLLNILVQSINEERNLLTSKWSLIKKYQMKPAFAKAANLIIDGSPYAVSGDAIVFLFSDEPQANQLNDDRHQPLLQKLMEEIQGKPVFCYGISEAYSRQLSRIFITMQKAGNLPPASPIEEPKRISRPSFHPITNQPTEENKNLELAKSLFGDFLKVKGE